MLWLKVRVKDLPPTYTHTLTQAYNGSPTLHLPHELFHLHGHLKTKGPWIRSELIFVLYMTFVCSSTASCLITSSFVIFSLYGYTSLEQVYNLQQIQPTLVYSFSFISSVLMMFFSLVISISKHQCYISIRSHKSFVLYIHVAPLP